MDLISQIVGVGSGAALLCLAAPDAKAYYYNLGAIWQAVKTTLAFTTEPTPTATVGVAFSATVSVEGQTGAVIQNASNSITLNACGNAACGWSAAGTLTGGGAASASHGVISFSSLTYNKADSIYLQAQSTNLASTISTQIAFAAGAPSSLTIDGPTYLTSGGCMGPFTVYMLDQYGNPASISTGSTTVSLAQSGSATFWGTAACGPAPIVAVSIAANTTSKTFYVKDPTVSDTPNLTASATGLTSGSFQASVSNPGPSPLHVGNTSTCFVNSAGGVECWGLNDFGQLGNGTNTDSFTAVQVSGLTSGVTGLGGGYNFHCALKSGNVWCWGQNSKGQLGNNTATNQNTPVEVINGSSVALAGVTALAQHGYQTMCAVSSGAAKCWGLNSSGQVGTGGVPTAYKTYQAVSGLGSGVTEIDSGDAHSCAVVSGNIYCWGANASGQLGNNTTTASTTPVEVLDPTGAANLTGALHISTGQAFACATYTVAATPAAVCWGDNTYNELGNNSTTSSSLPVQVSGLTASVTSISTGMGTGNGNSVFACAVMSGAMECWGSSGDGQCGNAMTNPTPVTPTGLSSGVAGVRAGVNDSCAVLSTGNIVCMGYNDNSNCGMGFWTTNRYSAVMPQSIY